jgi:F0F1-type ATP synthase delta subunit
MLQTSLDRMNDLIDVALQQRRTALLPDVLRRFEEAADHVAALRKSVGA